VEDEFSMRHTLLILCLLAFASLSFGQTVSLAPKMPQTALGTTIQFTATVTGLSNTAVKWSAGGTAGGNTTAGTISISGLYTAPVKMPGQNPVQIVAASVASPNVKATTYVYLLTAPPTVTNVTPNPLPTGTYPITVTGATFVSGAMIKVNGVQLATTFVNANTLTATGWQSPSTTSDSIVVTNPGSAPSAPFTVPAGATAPQTYTLTVVNGTGSGTYTAGSAVTIKANAPPAGQSFLNWTGATVANASAATTTLTMPAANATVTANFAAVTTYPLTVVNGSGSGNYAAGAVVTIAANAPPAGQAFANWRGATVANPTASTTTLTMPAAAITVTANYVTATYTLTVNNGSGSGTYAAGTVVNIAANAPPAGQVFQGWTGATVADATAASTTVTMPAANATVTATYSTPLTVPYPVSTHPRLWVTVNDLPRLQSWAVATNPIYQQGMVPLLNTAVNVYQTQFFPGGAANPNYPDPGDTQGYQGYLTEQYGLILAFHSLIDPSSANRIQYAQYARNMLMYAMNQAVLGHQSNTPFRDPLFAVYNRGNGSGEQWPLIVDWIYNATDAQGNPILTAADKLTIRNVFLIWANDCLNAYTTGGDHPAPIGVMNSLQLLPNNQPYRMAANNYYLGHARLLTMMALAIDPSDDPPVAGVPSSQLGSTLRGYLADALGAWLYQEYAMFGDGPTVAAAYGVPGGGAGFGLASGGLPPEGMLYGHSYAFLLGQLLALQTAGFHTPAISGPQIGLINAPMWDRFVRGFTAALVPAPKTFASEQWLGPIYQYGSYGDLLRLWATPDFMQPFSLLALLEQQNGKTSNLATERWYAVNAVEGGAAALMNRITQPFSWSTTQSILYYLLLDPAAAPAPDPRPSMPLTFYDPAAGRIIAHSDWSANGSMFNYRASWISINHQLGDAGMFELYRKGEWLTKEMSNYDNNAVGLTTVYHNTLALQNWSAAGTPSLQWYENGEWANGSQWMLGLSAGDPTTVTSSGPGYLQAASDLTKLYNRPNFWTPSAGATDITQAARSIVWLNNDYIVVYDRATSIHSGLFKRFHLSLVTNPAINGNTATETLASGQQLFVQSLLPLNATMTARYAAGDLNPIAELEPTQYVMTVQDPSNPTDTRFLHVLQGADPGAAMAPATYVQSTSGTAFDGAVFGSTVVYFPVNASNASISASLPVGSAHTALITGLTPGGTYDVSVSGGVLTIAAGTGSTADAGGVLRVTF
jgi:hypothetical protein